MPAFPNEILTPTYLLGLIQERPDLETIKQQYIWRKFFPPTPVPERRVSWESTRSENNLAGLYDPRGSATPADDALFSTYFSDLIDVRMSRIVDSDVLQKIRDPGMPAVYRAGGDSSFVLGIDQRIKTKIGDVITYCDNGIEAQLEYFAIGALMGSIVWPPQLPGNVTMPHWNPKKTVAINFPRYPNFEQNATTLTGYNGKTGKGIAWNTTDADIANRPDPIYDLEVIAELMDEEHGIDMDNATIMMSRGTLVNIARNSNLTAMIMGNDHSQNDAREFAGYKAIQNYVKTSTGLNILIYRGGWTYRQDVDNEEPTITRVRFLPEGRVLIIPNTDVGIMAMSPHEAQDESWVQGKTVKVYRDPRSYVREIEEHIVAWPIVQRGLEVFSLDAYA